MCEYYAHFFLPAHVQDPQHEIYKSVVGGTIRARYRGHILTTEEAAALAETNWDANSPYALPPEIQLSVEDALIRRKATAHRLAEIGCSTNQIAAITGHASLAEVERYTKAANRKRMASEAMTKLVEGGA